RRDPLAEAWPTFEQWLLEDPTLTAKEILERVPSALPNAAVGGAQIRTLQRRIKTWRSDRAKYLVLGHGVLPAEPAASASCASECEEVATRDAVLSTFEKSA
ncbi:MAG: hypothetical protein ACYDBH_16835, partial [Acidobacteriaceae bacterium]